VTASVGVSPAFEIGGARWYRDSALRIARAPQAAGGGVHEPRSAIRARQARQSHLDRMDHAGQSRHHRAGHASGSTRATPRKTTDAAPERNRRRPVREPDASLTLDDAVAEADPVASRFTWRARQGAGWTLEAQGGAIVRFADGQI